MSAIVVHTCPLWEEADGTRRIGMEYEEHHPPVVGWVNVLEVKIGGETHLLLLGNDVTEDD